MCYEEDRLLAYLDGETTAEERDLIAAHLGSCPECTACTARLEADRTVASDALRLLQPTGDVVAMPAPRRTSRLAAFGWGKVAAVAAAVLLLGSFAFAPVRSGAAGLLQIFRVQDVQTVSLTQADLQSITDALQSGSGHIDLKSMGEVWIDGTEAKPKTVTLAEAKAAVDFPIKLPKDATGQPTITLQAAQTYRFKLNVAAINAALKSYGSDRTLPAGLDGKVFSVEIPAVVLAAYGDTRPVDSSAGVSAGSSTLFVGQARSPELVVPEDVDAAALRDVLLNLPFLPESVRSQLASISDWQSTLIVPNVDGTAHDVTIDGVHAVVITPKSPARDARRKLGPLPPDNAAVIWNQDGIVRGIGGTINEETAISLAKSTM